MNSKRIFYFPLLFVLLSFQMLAQDFNPDTIKLKEILNQLADKYNVPDYAFAIICKDKITFTADKNKENKGKNYLIGSCSKSYTAYAILKLAEEGKIDLDKPVKKYLPWFELKNKNYSEKVTVRNLLNHKSGIERQYGFFNLKTNDAAKYEQGLAKFIKNIDVNSAPGTAFLYSNTNYNLLGLVIQKVTGQSYSEYMKSILSSDIGLHNTFFCAADNNGHNLIQAYQYLVFNQPFKSKNYYYSDYIVSSGYISSNVLDISNYLKFLLNKTVTNTGDTILSDKNYAALTGINAKGYAMGWFHFKMDSIDVVCHSGLDENYAASYNMFPSLGIGYIILCNSNSFGFCGQVDQEMQSLISGKPNMHYPDNEKLLRWIPNILPIILLLVLIYNTRRWKKHGFQFGFVKKVLPSIRILLGLILSMAGLYLLTSMYQIFVSDMIRFGPDIAWGFILVAILGILSSFIRYFGTYSKLKVKSGI